jgi:histidinol-phosphate aminotransferase
MNFEEFVSDFEPYSTEENTGNIKMNKNESPYQIKSVKEAFNSNFGDLKLNRYPEIDYKSLREKLAESKSFYPGNLVMSNGSDKLIDLVLTCLDGGKVIVNTPTFSMYSVYAEINKMEVEEVPLTKDFRLDLEAVKEEIEDAAAVFLCSPNSPTGNVIERSKIIELLETDTAVILDEAYVEFAKSSNADLIREYSNLIILRTFSKALSLAGARLGYAIASKETAKKLRKVQAPYTVDKTSIELGKLTLENYSEVEDKINTIKKERKRLVDRFEGISYPSQSNFILMDVNAADYLKENGIDVRSFSGRLSDKIRVTVGTPNQNEKFIEKLEAYRNE